MIPRELNHNPDKHPAIVPLDLNSDDRRALVFFLFCLTDPRVQLEQAPFDHPSLRIVNGYENIGGTFVEQTIDLDHTGASGSKAPARTFPANN